MGWSIGYDENWKRDMPILFYTYLWLREDGTPYYVGKGSGDRAFKRRPRRVGYPPPEERIVVTYHESEEAAFLAEKALIKYYGRKDIGTGCLANLTDGGENPPCHRGKKQPPEWGQKRSAALKGRRGEKQSEETKLKRRLTLTGMKRSPETIERIRAAMTGYKYSKQVRDALSVQRKGRNKGVPWSTARREAETRRKLCRGQ